MDQHSRAWKLIQKRQDLLNNLESQASARRAELKKLTSDIAELTDKRESVLEGLREEAYKSFLETNSKLVSRKRQLTFEIMELNKRHQDTTSKVEFSWAEHRDLVQVVNNLNQEVNFMMAEVQSESNRSKTILKDLEEQIIEKKADRLEASNQVQVTQQTIKNLTTQSNNLEIQVKNKYVELESIKGEYKSQVGQLVATKKETSKAYQVLDKVLKQVNEISSKDKAMRESMADERLKWGQERDKNKAELADLQIAKDNLREILRQPTKGMDTTIVSEPQYKDNSSAFFQL